MQINGLDFLLTKYRWKIDNGLESQTFYNENLIKEEIEGIKFLSLAPHENSFEYENENLPEVKEFRERLKKIKDIMYDVGAYMEILSDIYSDKLNFLKKRSNAIAYLHNASVNYVVIKLSELIGKKKSKLSIRDLLAYITSNKKQLFEQFTIRKKYVFDDKVEIYDYPHFDELEDFCSAIEEYLVEAENQLKSLKEIRDQHCCHISDKFKVEEIKFSFENLKTIYNDFYDIFNSISLVQDWTKPIKPCEVFYNINLKDINDMAKYGEEKKKEEKEIRINEMRKES